MKCPACRERTDHTLALPDGSCPVCRGTSSSNDVPIERAIECLYELTKTIVSELRDYDDRIRDRFKDGFYLP